MEGTDKSIGVDKTIVYHSYTFCSASSVTKKNDYLFPLPLTHPLISRVFSTGLGLVFVL